MAPFNLDRSYSRRSSSRRSRFSVFFFIMFSFALRCLTDAYNPDVLVAVHMGNEQNPARPRHSNGDKALFRCGMIRVWSTLPPKDHQIRSRPLGMKPGASGDSV